MVLRLLSAMGVVMLIAPFAAAETYGEKFSAVDVEKKTVTFPVDGEDRTFKVDDKVSVQAQRRVGKRLTLSPVRDGLKGVKPGMEATITTEKKDGVEVVTKIVLLVAEGKGPKDK
jgi:hypothetical protein